MFEVTQLGALALTTANVLYIFCYIVRDVLWLRILAVAAMLIMIIYYAWGLLDSTQNFATQWSCIYWQTAFISINLVWIGLIFHERRPPRMTDEQKHLYDLVFRTCCSPQDMLKLLAAGNWCNARPGDRLVSKGIDLDKLLLIYEGSASVLVDDQLLATLRGGDLVGEMSFLTRQLTVADVIAKGPMRYLCWNRKELEELFARRVELRSAINALIGHDLIQKLTSSQGKVPELSVDSQIISLDEFRRITE
jgi:CRP-like cAMP-binding protein